MNLVTVDSKDRPRNSPWCGRADGSGSELNATGTVFPDVSREVPVISLANGRVVDIQRAARRQREEGAVALQRAERRRHATPSTPI